MSDIAGYIRSYKNGNLEAFSDIYEASVKKIYDFLFYKTFDETIAQDLTSDTFMKALRNMKNFSGSTERELLAWLYRIAYNTLIDHHRQAKETTDLDEVGEILGHDAWLNRDIDDRNKLEEVLTYLESLPIDQKNIVIMRIWDDLSYSEIAELSGKSADNCKKIVSRVLKQIQANVAFMIFIAFIIR